MCNCNNPADTTSLLATLRNLANLNTNSTSAIGAEYQAKAPIAPIPCICEALTHLTDPIKLITALLQCGFNFASILACIPQGIITAEGLMMCLLSIKPK